MVRKNVPDERKSAGREQTLRQGPSDIRAFIEATDGGAARDAVLMEKTKSIGAKRLERVTRKL